MPRPSAATDQTTIYGENFAHARKLRGLSLRGLSSELAALGRPINPDGLNRIEKGRRKVTVEEVFAIAWALAVPPITLMLPVGSADVVEVVPGCRMPTFMALQWFDGERPPAQYVEGGEEPVAEPPPFDPIAFLEASTPVKLLHKAQQAVNDVRRAYEGITRAMFEFRPDGTDPVTDARNAYLEALRSYVAVDGEVREHGLTGPGLDEQYHNDAVAAGIIPDHPNQENTTKE